MITSKEFFVASIFSRIVTMLRWRFLKPRVPKLEPNQYRTITLGSKYGRKTLVPPKTGVEELLVISGGVGEDISFDVELANLYPSRIILVDPSEMAIAHFNQVLNAMGESKQKVYSNSSRQDISSYDLSCISSETFKYLPVGLWNESKNIKFYDPPDKRRDASGSINGIHSNYKTNQISTQIEVVTINKVMEIVSASHIDILKLDIEGAALEVISRMFNDEIFPTQILVEIDEMHFPGFKSKFRAEMLFRLIRKHGYELVAIDSCDFLYVRFDHTL